VSGSFRYHPKLMGTYQFDGACRNDTSPVYVGSAALAAAQVLRGPQAAATEAAGF